MKKKHFWAVCYGHVCRWAEDATAKAAAKSCFGMVDFERMTVREFPSNPKYMPLKTRTPFLNALYERHKEKTGSVIGCE